MGEPPDVRVREAMIRATIGHITNTEHQNKQANSRVVAKERIQLHRPKLVLALWQRVLRSDYVTMKLTARVVRKNLLHPNHTKNANWQISKALEPVVDVCML